MINNSKIKKANRYKRHNRIRAKIKGSQATPRLCVFRSNSYIYSQLIDDGSHSVLMAVSEKNIDSQGIVGKIKRAYEVGKRLAILANEIKIKRVVFDKGGYKYHGRVKALADGAREGGLVF
ncbi:50S ribosomal protein L18 [Candidatus Azambacteria bacterium]|nr:50S ribosomal protein L18 [Candidatus Azambacteria bacterium]